MPSIRIDGDSISKIKATLSLDRKTWTEFRIRCLRENKTASEIIEAMIEAFLKKQS